MVLHSDTNEHQSHVPAKKVLIVDDSRVIRMWLRTVLASDRRLEVVGEASDAVEARDYIRANPADVITLDIEMPGMSGLEFLTRLMRARPMPVVMLSSLTSKGSDAAVQALSRGAIDCILKPTDGYDLDLSRDICERVYQAACTRPASLKRGEATEKPADAPMMQRASALGQPCRRGSLILIGASTGGVSALEAVLPKLDPDGAPVVIVQHMPGNFLESFSQRLDRQLPQNVKLAEEGVPLRRGDVILAPGIGKHTEVVRRMDGWQCRFVANDPAALHCPSVDTLFLSAVSEAKKVSVAILTGLGKDGAQGMLKLAEAGATTFGQDEETSVVYGMPRVAFGLGAVQHQLPIHKIGEALRESKNASARTARRTTKVPLQ
ncbi:chemotaxis-specific protein-glutamate methyltransferase CheB [Roseobacter denitrificans]|uniref:chemotaxis-specific protein-glutamate methyltransferase CheB n=1 Tax=Roseobacter denitrificans TaxID=2434 RepID=UPI0003193F74|nr:chemotaxis-specific protein-glutamate methyltransferase CheB [Roseobacter denitrificans]SFF86351.1 two-component system, chemotaxis family, response regulator CheB [Roseobacter denitrificans OCh 114]